MVDIVPVVEQSHPIIAGRQSQQSSRHSTSGPGRPLPHPFSISLDAEEHHDPRRLPFFDVGSASLQSSCCSADMTSPAAAAVGPRTTAAAAAFAGLDDDSTTGPIYATPMAVSGGGGRRRGRGGDGADVVASSSTSAAGVKDYCECRTVRNRFFCSLLS